MNYDEDGYPEVIVPDLSNVLQAVSGGNCIPFFGAGASMGYSFNGASADGIPSGRDLTLTLLREAGLAADAQIAMLNDPAAPATPEQFKIASKLLSYDLYKAADCFLYKRLNERRELDTLLRREVAKANGPRPIHTVIAQIQDIYTVLTTNYDGLFENACETYGRDLTTHVHEQFRSDNAAWDAPWVLHKPQVFLHKMHGCRSVPSSMIITRADYIRYLANWNDPAKGMPAWFSKRLPTSSLLFLGYSLGDWNFLAIWEGIVASKPRGNKGVRSFAIMKSVSDEDRDYLRDQNIEVIECDLTHFAVT